MTTNQAATARAGRAEAAVQVLLMVAVGGVAGAAAWSHVVHLAVQHGQPGWLAWADAAVIETLAVSAGLEIRRRRRAGHPAGFVLLVLAAAVALSLAAQVAQAEPSPWGWTMAAVPALGFLLLAKIALAADGSRPADDEAAGDATRQTRPRRPTRDTPLAGAEDPADRRRRLTRDRVRAWRRRRAPHPTPAAVPDAGPRPTQQPAAAARPATKSPTPRQPARPRASRPPAAPKTVPVGPTPSTNGDALLAAGMAVLADLHRDGTALTRNSLTDGLRRRDVRLSTSSASSLLRTLRQLPHAEVPVTTGGPPWPRTEA